MPLLAEAEIALFRVTGCVMRTLYVKTTAVGLVRIPPWRGADPNIRCAGRRDGSEGVTE